MLGSRVVGWSCPHPCAALEHAPIIAQPAFHCAFSTRSLRFCGALSMSQTLD